MAILRGRWHGAQVQSRLFPAFQLPMTARIIGPDHVRLSCYHRDKLALHRCGKSRCAGGFGLLGFVPEAGHAMKALELLANLKPGQDVVAQLEFGEHLVQSI